ncbi:MULTISPECIES: cysteine--tRNA ligase [Pseudofrankia]|uniref:cysteine--tRNA ligase n=1 Tax=Pseudofrankia TaxID=2994363 RepID=UPI000234B46C|nr:MULTISPECIES: cysteine--tRNA ligase [Pseudofrankia]OHV32937.1 cysteine--tRNA ligase [Pseudofrankia sp. EUN1h]
MSLHLYDTRTRRARPFEPLRPGHVGIYVCGPTVQSGPHVGHLRSAVAFDLLRRWLLASGYAVTYVQNVTDIDDKIITNAGREGISVWELATRETRAFDDAYRSVGILPPTIEPRATAHIPEMHALIARLIEAGFAYEGAGSVWFRVGRYADYGALSNQRPDAMQASPEAEPGKADPRDFALWKASRPGEPAWESPWGLGRPGWHLECSAMAGKYLGQVFDIHGGGLDLVFPHHENERAQTVCATAGHGGLPAEPEMARYWMHTGLLTTGGTKMSKSLGNSFFVTDVLEQVRPQVLRYHLLSAHYRSTLEYSAATLAESAAAYDRVETFVRNALDILGGPETAAALATEGPAAPAHQEPRARGKSAKGRQARGGQSTAGADAAPQTTPAALWADFARALDDDLSIGRAFAALFGAVSQGNQVLAKAHSRELASWVVVARRMLAVLGLDPVEQWPAAGAELRPALDSVMEIVLDLRSSARARRDFSEADSIRARLTAAGIIVDDTPEGQRWHL